MNDAETQFAERLGDDLARVLGVGIAIDDIELQLAADGGGAHAVATLLIDGRVETIEANAADLLALYQPIIQRAAELRLAAAFWQMIGPT